MFVYATPRVSRGCVWHAPCRSRLQVRLARGAELRQAHLAGRVSRAVEETKKARQAATAASLEGRAAS
jgi:hypothetical protein